VSDFVGIPQILSPELELLAKDSLYSQMWALQQEEQTLGVQT